MGIVRGNETCGQKEALERLEALCAKREVCTSQVEQKLYLWGVDKQLYRSILEILYTKRYVDDRRYAEAFVRDKSRFDKWGWRKIRQHLMAKRIPLDTVNEVVQEVVEADIPNSVLKELARKSETTKHKNDYDLKMKLVAYGVRKGYDFDKVQEAVENVLKNRM